MKTKRFLAVLVAMLLVLTAVPAISLADDAAADVVTLQFYGAGNRNGTFDGFLNNMFTEKYGFRIEEVIADLEKTQALLASGDLPDVGYYQVNNSLSQAIAGNLLVELTPYLDQLPNVTANYQYALDVCKKLFCEDKGYYGINTGVGEVTVEAQFPIDPSHNTMNIKWDVYQAIGAPAMDDIYDLIPILKQMMEAQPELADGTKTWGLGLSLGWGEGSEFAVPTVAPLTNTGCLESFYGLNEVFYGNNDAETLTGILDEGSKYLDGVRFYYEANQAGILDPDSIIQYYTACQAKVYSGVYMMAAWAQWVDSYNETGKNAETPTAYLPISCDWQYASLNNSPKYGSNPIAISATTEKLDTCLTFLNAFYDAETAMEFRNGPKGLLWDKDEDGNYYSTPEYDKVLETGSYILETGEDVVQYITGYGVNFDAVVPGTTLPIRQGLWPSTIEANIKDNKMLDSYEAATGYRRPIEYFIANDRVIKRPAWVGLTAAMDEDTQMLSNAVSECVRTATWKMIYAKDEAEFNSLYEEMYAQAKTLGYDTVKAWGVQAWNDAKALNDEFSK